MNLDDFVLPDNDPASTSSIVVATSQPANNQPEDELAHAAISAIPINKKTRPGPSQPLIPQSVPVPRHQKRVQDEFGYVPRHHRKTSIDERRVSQDEEWFLDYHGRVYQFNSATSYSLSVSGLFLFLFIITIIMAILLTDAAF